MRRREVGARLAAARGLAGRHRDGQATGPATRPSVGLVYDHDPEEVEELGWEEFVARQWDSIFTGYRSWTGLRKMGRRWSDLIEAGLGCSQEIADRLVRAEIMERADRDLEGAADARAVVAGMVGVLTDMRADLAEMAAAAGTPGMDGLRPELPATLLDRHARLVSFVRAHAFGQDDDQAPVR
jgi:hypothetical protein